MVRSLVEVVIKFTQIYGISDWNIYGISLGDRIGRSMFSQPESSIDMGYNILNIYILNIYIYVRMHIEI